MEEGEILFKKSLLHSWRRDLGMRLCSYSHHPRFSHIVLPFANGAVYDAVDGVFDGGGGDKKSFSGVDGLTKAVVNRQVELRFGQPIHTREWFLVPLPAIEDAILW